MLVTNHVYTTNGAPYLPAESLWLPTMIIILIVSGGGGAFNYYRYYYYYYTSVRLTRTRIKRDNGLRSKTNPTVFNAPVKI